MVCILALSATMHLKSGWIEIEKIFFRVVFVFHFVYLAKKRTYFSFMHFCIYFMSSCLERTSKILKNYLRFPNFITSIFMFKSIVNVEFVIIHMRSDLCSL